MSSRSKVRRSASGSPAKSPRRNVPKSRRRDSEVIEESEIPEDSESLRRSSRKRTASKRLQDDESSPPQTRRLKEEIVMQDVSTADMEDFGEGSSSVHYQYGGQQEEEEEEVYEEQVGDEMENLDEEEFISEEGAGHESWDHDWSHQQMEPDAEEQDMSQDLSFSARKRSGLTPKTEIGAIFAEKIRQTKLRQSTSKKLAIEAAVAEYPLNVKIFDTRCITSFEEAARVMLSRRLEDIPKKLISTAPPRHAPVAIREVTFLIDTRCVKYTKDILLDKHGNWGKVWRSNAYYSFNQMEQSVRRLDIRDVKNKYIPPDYDAKLIKRLSHHPGTGGRLSKHVYTAEDMKGRPWPLALVGYQWHEGTDPFEFDGNSVMPAQFEDDIYGGDEGVEDLEGGGLISQDYYGGGVKVFSRRAITDFQKATEIITEENLDASRVSQSVPLGAPLKTDQVSFVVDLMCLRDMKEISLDNHGYWGKGNMHRDYFYFDEDVVKRADKESVRRRDFDVAAVKYLYRHPNTANKLMKHIYTAKDKSGTLFRYALISYQWLVKPFAFEAADEMETMVPNEDGSFPNSKVLRTIPRKLDPDEQDARLRELRGEYYGQRVHPHQALIPFGPTAIREFKDAVDVMIRMEPGMFPTSVVVPPEGPLDQQEISYVVDLKALETPEHIFVDNHGSWGKCGGDSVYYKAYEDQLQELRGSVGREFTVKITKARYRHPNADNKLRKFVFTCRNPKGRLLRWGIVSYKWDECLPFRFKPGPPVRNYGGPQYLFDRPKMPKRMKMKRAANSQPVVEMDEIFEEIPETMAELEDFSRVELEEAEEEPDLIDPEEQFPVGVVPFSARVVNTMIEAAHILLRRDPPGPLCSIVPFSAPKKMRKISYLIDLQALDDPKDVQVDLHGSWGHNPGPEKAYFRYNAWGGVKRLDGGKGKVENSEQYDVKMTKMRYLHDRTDRKLRKFIFIAQNANGEYLRWGLISYQWFCEPFDFTPAPHGNAKKNLRPFQPTKPSVRTRLKELSLVFSPEQAIQEYLTEKGETMTLAAPHDLPRGPKQVSDSGRFPRSIHRAAALICKHSESNIRPFPRNPDAFSVMDETLGKDASKCYTVNRIGQAEFACDCEEFNACFICRHSLAVARTENEAKEFVENLAERIKDREMVAISSQEVAEMAGEYPEHALPVHSTKQEEWEQEEEEAEPPPDEPDEVEAALGEDVELKIQASSARSTRSSWRRKSQV